MEDTDERDRTALMHAAIGGHVDTVRFFLDRGVSFMAIDKLDKHVLMYADEFGHTEALNLLLARGVERTAVNSRGYTSLMYTAEYGHIEMAKLLLERGADPTMVYKDGATAISYAASHNHTELIELLIRSGVDPSLPSTQRFSLLCRALEKNTFESFKILLDWGAPINSVDRDGSTPLHRAVEVGQIDIVESLLDRGADIDAVDSLNTTTVLHEAASGISLNLIQVLLERGANSALIDGFGRTAWDYVAMYPPCWQVMMNSTHKIVRAPREGSYENLRESLKKSLLFIQSREVRPSYEQTDSTYTELNNLTSSWWMLGKALVFLDNKEAALLALEQRIAIWVPTGSFNLACHRCDTNESITTAYICMCCVSIELCEPCYAAYESEPRHAGCFPKYVRCRRHEFLKVPRDV